MNKELPEWLTKEGTITSCKHDYVDVYGGQGLHRTNRNAYLCWVFCKKCLDKKLLTFSMRDFLLRDEDEEKYGD